MYDLIEYNNSYSKASKILCQYRRDVPPVYHDDAVTDFTETNAKIYVSVETLSTKDNAKLLEQFKDDFKRTIGWKNYQTKASIERKKVIFRLIDPSFQGVNKLFFLSFESEAETTSSRRYYLPKKEIKNDNDR